MPQRGAKTVNLQGSPGIGSLKLFIKPRAARGKSYWTAKIVLPSLKQKNQYVAAAAFAGIYS
jgi:hypothetical protein